MADKTDPTGIGPVFCVITIYAAYLCIVKGTITAADSSCTVGADQIQIKPHHAKNILAGFLIRRRLAGFFWSI